MKKILILILALILAVSLLALAGCSGCNNTPDDGGNSGTTTGEPDNDATPTLQDAKSYLRAMYKDSAEMTPASYTVVNVVLIGETEFTVEWSVNVTSGSADDVKLIVDDENKQTKVELNTDAAEDAVYELKATIKDAAGNTEELVFNHTLPKFKELSWAEYIAKAADEAVTVKGVITGIVAKSKGASNNCVYFQDSDGGYYAYQMSTDPVTDDKLEVGMTIRVRGVKDIYSGTHEIKNGTVEILNKEKTAVTPADYTEIFKNAKSLKDSALVNVQSFLVTIKGVEIKAQDDTVSNGYFKFQLGELISYIRISSSTCPLTKDEQTAFKKAHGEHAGWTANVTGLVSIYDGAFYLTPVDANAIEYVSLPAKDDAGMVAFEKENLSLVSAITEDTEITLPATGASYNKVTITWVSDNAAAVIKDGKLIITMPDSDITVKITATLKSGDVTDTKVFEIKLLAAEMTYEQIVEAAYKLAENETLPGTHRLFGKIVSIDEAYSDQYKNITLTIQVGNFTDKLIKCFRMKGDGAETLAVGDEITVEGTIKNYKGTVEFDSGCKLIGKGEHIDQSKTVKAAYALEKGASMSYPVILTGVISKIDTAYSEQYKNITVTIIVDGLTDQPIQCFHLTGTDADKLAEGQTITVFGVIKNYNGTVEFDAGCKLISKDDLAAAKTVAAAYKLLPDAALEGEQTLTGEIVEITTAYSEQYQNITVTIKVAGLDKYLITCFRMKGEGAENLAKGDVITVKGTIKNYKGTVEFDSGCTFTK